MADSHRRRTLESLFAAALAAVDPARCVLPFIPPPTAGKTVVIGAGKAAAAMARGIEDRWPGDIEQLGGLVVTRYGHGLPTRRIEVVEAAHPVPDAAGQRAAARILQAVQGLGPEDQILALFSGGGSALLALPCADVTLAQKQAITRQLLASGARIGEINTLRKHLSAIKGGRLAQAARPTPITTLLLSDVPGDDPSIIAGGPTVADPSTAADALSIADKYKIELPAHLRHRWRHAAASLPADAFAHCSTHIVATAHTALTAAAQAARAMGIPALVLGDRIEGEAREVARVLGGIALACAATHTPLAPPCVILSGGETGVTLGAHTGRGGRNSEFLLALSQVLAGHPQISALACDTDGIDGMEDNAGAAIFPDTPLRAAAMAIDVAAQLENHNSYEVFSRLGDLVVTGPTRTNVNDFRAILIERKPE